MAAEKTGKHAYRVMIENQAQKTHRVLDVVPHAGSLGQTIYIEAQKGDLYRLAELLGDEVGYAPESLKVARVGADLHITFADDTVADLIISRYYDVIPADSLGVVGQAFDGQVYSYLQWQQVYQGNVPTLADGMDPTLVGLGGNPISEPVGNAFAGLNVDPTIAAIGLLGLLGLAGGGGGGGSSSGGGESTPPKLVIDSVTDDNVLNSAEAGQTIAVTGKAYGTFAEGDEVTLTINGKTVTGSVNAQGEFSIDVAGSDLVADSDTKIEASLVAHDATGNSGTVTASHVYGVDQTGPAPFDPNNPDNPNGNDPTQPADGTTSLVLASVTSDDVINSTEAGQTIAITGKAYGTFAEGDEVTLTINGKTFTGSVNDQGVFSIDVAGSDLTADGDTTIEASLVAHDAAGNSGTVTASHVYGVDQTGPAPFDPNNPNNPNGNDPTQPADGTTSLVLDSVTSDDVINSTEAGQTIAITGKAYGTFAEGDEVTLTINGKTFTGSVNDQGVFSIDVAGNDLTANGDTTIEASLVAHDAAGNSGTVTASHVYGVDQTGPAPFDPNNPDNPNGNDPTQPADGTTSLVLDSVTSDDVINSTEAGQTIAITGKAYGTFAEGDEVTLTINGKTVTGSVNAQGVFSIDVAGSELAADGDTTIEASLVAHDAAGNSGTMTASHVYVVDVTPPGQQENGDIVGPTLSIEAATDEYVNLAELHPDDPEYRNDAILPAVVTLPLRSDDGDTLVFTITKDGGEPKTFIQTITSDDVSNEDVTVDLVPVWTDSGWTSDGTYSITVNTHDAAGNYSTPSETLTFTVDTALPEQNSGPLQFGTTNNDKIIEDGNTVSLNLLANTDAGSSTGLTISDLKFSINDQIIDASTWASLNTDKQTITIDPTAEYFQDLAQNETRTISLEYVVTDAAGNVNATNHTADITVTGVNDAPVLDLDSMTDGSGFAIYNWNGSPTSIISESISISDIDNATLSSLSVSFATVNGTTFNSNGVTSSQSIGDGSITYSFEGPFTPERVTTILQGLEFSSENPTTKTEIVITVSDGIDSTSATTTLYTTSAPSVQQLNDSADIIQSDNAPLSFAPLPTSAQMDLFSEPTVADPVDSPASSDAGTADALAQVVTDLATAAAQALGADSAAALDEALASDIESVDWNAVLTPEVVGQVDEALSALDQLDLSGFTLDPALSSLLDHWASSADTAAVLTSLAADDALRQLIDQQLSTVALGAVV